MSYEIQSLHSIGEEFHFRRTLIAMHTIRENPCNPWLKNLPSKPATADSRLIGEGWVGGRVKGFGSTRWGAGSEDSSGIGSLSFRDNGADDRDRAFEGFAQFDHLRHSGLADRLIHLWRGDIAT
jgi:hypothetical protein